MLQNAYFLAKISAGTAENEQHFSEICQKLATTLRVEDPGEVPLHRAAGGTAPPASAMTHAVPADITARLQRASSGSTNLKEGGGILDEGGESNFSGI